MVVQRFGTLPTVSHDHQLEDNILETQRQNQVNLAIIFGLVMTCGFKDVDVYEQLWDLGPGHHFLIFFGQVCDFFEKSLGDGKAEQHVEFAVGIPFACQCNFHIGKKKSC